MLRHFALFASAFAVGFGVARAQDRAEFARSVLADIDSLPTTHNTPS